MYENYLKNPAQQATQRKTGVLITNLGTPDFPTKKYVKKYLAEFLSDTRVVEPPPHRWIWQFFLRTIILNTRPQKVQKNYAKIWDSVGYGSPLLTISKLQLTKISALLKQHDGDLACELGMRYGNPSIQSGLRNLHKKGCEKIIVLPLYPQYCSATTGATFDALSAEIKTWRVVPELVFIQSYAQNNAYIQALVNSVKTYQKTHGKPDQLIISYHGIPQRYVDQGDTYYQQCVMTAELLANALGLKTDAYQITFQSIFGREAWLEPRTDVTLKTLAEQGNQHVQVICPGFASDCLETLEEINIENREKFICAGGAKFGYIPALNADDKHIQMLADLIIAKQFIKKSSTKRQ